MSKAPSHKADSTDLATATAAPLPAITDDPFASHEGEGLEHIRSTDLIIPRLTALHKQAPQCNPKKAEYIEGAKQGDICDTGNGELFEAPLLFLPVYYVTQWLQWAPRASSKGYPIKIYDTDEILEECTKPEKGPLTLPNGDYIQETAQFFGLNLSAGARRSFLPMKSSQLKKARKLLTLSSAEREKREDGTFYTPPIYFRVYKLFTVDESNADGDWAGWKVERGPKLKEFGEDWREILKEAQAFRESVKKGEVKGELRDEQEAHSSGESDM